MADASDSTPAPSRRAFLAHAALSSVAVTRPPIFTVPEPPDTDLITLGADLTTAWTRFSELEKDGGGADSDAAWLRATGAARLIATVRATTLAGLLVKARAIAWLHGGDADEPTDDEPTDQRIARTIVGDLLAMA